jgi:NAD(P)-dependent dehydrogenase (short-subunit alcohol dehydrogenase family)
VRRVAVITGTTHGIGRVTSRELAKAGYAVAMLCRDLEAAAGVRAEIAAAVPGAYVQIFHCDLASLTSVRTCAAEVLQEFPGIDRLINNAGMVSARRHFSEDGYELTFATNHLGPFLLTELLRGRMTSDGRIINLASKAHFRAKGMNLQAVTDRQAPYNGIAAYAQSKLANIMHTFALARRLSGSGVTVNCLHPGVITSNLLPFWLRLIKPLISRGMLDVERGSRTTLHLALSNEVANMSGHYFDENQAVRPVLALANDADLQESVWKYSARWTGLAD